MSNHPRERFGTLRRHWRWAIYVSLVLAMLFGALVLTATGQKAVTTDKFDYAPGETVIIAGTGFADGAYDVPVIIPAILTVEKFADPAGGTEFPFTVTYPDATTEDFSLFGNEGGDSWTSQDLLDFGTLSVFEHTPTSWQLDSTTCSDAYTGQTGIDPASINIQEGSDVTCTFNNSLQVGTLTVYKKVIDDDGGMAVPGDFTLDIGVAGVSTFAGSLAGTTFVLIHGTGYDVTEDMGSWAGKYTDSYPATDPDFPGLSFNCTGTIEVGVDKYCLVVNDAIASKLTVIKYLVPDTDNGTFTLCIDGAECTATPVGHNGSLGPVSVSAGSYTVSESAGAGTDLNDYISEIGGDCDANGDVSLDVDQEKTCTITNTRKGMLAVTKRVIWYGEPDPAQTFEICIKGLSYPTGSEPGACQIYDSFDANWEQTLYWYWLKPGSYTIDETNLGPNWKVTYDPKTVTVNPGDEKTALVINEHEQVYLAWTPGFWKNHTVNSPSGHDAWQFIGHDIEDPVCGVFASACGQPYMDDLGNWIYDQTSMLDALSLPGGSSIIGASEILLRAAVAAYFDARFHEINGSFGFAPYPLSSVEVVALVNVALTGGASENMLSLAKTLDGYNKGGSEWWPIPW